MLDVIVGVVGLLYSAIILIQGFVKGYQKGNNVLDGIEGSFDNAVEHGMYVLGFVMFILITSLFWSLTFG